MTVHRFSISGPGDRGESRRSVGERDAIVCYVMDRRGSRLFERSVVQIGLEVYKGVAEPLKCHARRSERSTLASVEFGTLTVRITGSAIQIYKYQYLVFVDP